MPIIRSQVDANEGFPHDRVNAAKRYLYAVKPWWGRFGERMVIVPTYTVPREGAQWGAMTSTDQHLRLYIDRTFAAVAPFHVLAGAIEHEFQHHTHDTWKRLKWMSLDEWRDWANIVLDLEINSVIDEESVRLDVEAIRSALKKSAIFTQRDMRLWDVTAPPGLGDEGWIPRLIGLPNGLSAEEYYRLIHKPEGAHDNETASDETGEDAESQRDSDEQDGESGSSDGSEIDDSSSDPQSEHQGESQSDREPSGDFGNEEPESGDDDDEESGSAPSNDPSEDQSEGGSESSDHEQSDMDTSGMQGDGDTDTGDEGDGEPQEIELTDAGNASGDTDASAPTDTPGGEASSSPAEIIDEMRSDPINQMWASEIENPADPLSNPAWKPSDPPPAPTPGEIAEALAELEEDVHNEESIVPGFGLGSESRITKWAEDYRKSHKMDWGSRFEKLASSSLNSAKVHGQTDMSYAVRNPNQPMLGPIMMGMHGYSPVVYVLQDVSGSMLMNGGMKKSQSAFTDICKTLMERFGSTVTWFSADYDIRDVGRTTRWSEDLKTRWSYGGGGTDFGEAIGSLMRGKLIHKGKKYPKPDVLIVSSDCQFNWPETRPRGCKIIVVNVGLSNKAELYLPEWLNRKREYVAVD